MSEPWPSKRFVKRNPRLLKDHREAIEAGIVSFHTNSYIWKRAVCSDIGAPGYYCNKPGMGLLNWDFIKEGCLEIINGPRPLGNGDPEALHRYHRNAVKLHAVTEHWFEDIQETDDLSSIDPSRRRLWHPMTSGGHGADGWISNREPRFKIAVDEHYGEDVRMLRQRGLSLGSGIAGAYDSKVLDRNRARELLHEVLQPDIPMTLEDLTGT